MAKRAGILGKRNQVFMSKLSDLQLRMRSLRDIEAIMTAMKNLALVEITKISRCYATQQELLRMVKCALADFQRFYGTTANIEAAAQESLYVLIGSERGFCGAFNEAIRNKLSGEASTTSSFKLIVVGRKLALKFAEDKRVIAILDGPSAAEEIPALISLLARQLSQFSGSKCKIVYNSYSTTGISVEMASLFEFSGEETAPPFQFAPLLNLPASDIRPQLFEQYLFALFYGIFYLSFTAENHERLQHMDGALSKLQEEEQRLHQLVNSLRQESITEELEVIMLNVGGSQSR